MQPTNDNKRSGLLHPKDRMTVRIALATAATIATLMGTQALAFQDQSQGTATAVPAAQSTTIVQDTNVSLTNNTASTITSTPSTTNLTGQNVISSAPRQPQPVTRSSRR